MNTYTRSEAAARCGVTVEAIRQAIKRGELPPSPVSEAALQAWAARSSKETVRVARTRISVCRWCERDFDADKYEACPICTKE